MIFTFVHEDSLIDDDGNKNEILDFF